jgi:hypothetical protein
MRQRFRPAEKELLRPGTDVEIHIGSGNWVTGTITGTDVVKPSPDNYTYWTAGRIVGTQYTNGKRMTTLVRPGQTWRVTPGNVRPVGSDWKCTAS